MFSDGLMSVLVLAAAMLVGVVELVRRSIRNRKWKRAAWDRDRP